MKQGKFNVVTDLQWGSTGKGLMSTYLASKYRPQHISTTSMANAGHCQTADTVVITEDGITTLGELVGEDSHASDVELLNMHGLWEKCSFFLNDGVRVVNEITLKNGISFRCTDEHKYYVWDAELMTCQWVKSRHLNPAVHQFLLPKNNNYIGRDFHIVQDTDDRSNRVAAQYCVDDIVFAEFMGLLVGDGYYNNPRRISIAFDAKQTDAMDRVKSMLSRMGLDSSEYKIKGKKCKVLYIYQTAALYNYLSQLGMEPATGIDKGIPKAIYSAKKTIIAGFLRGFFDADGSAKGDRVTASNISESLIRGIQQLLFVLGINCGISHYDDPRDDSSRSRHYYLSVSGKQNLIAFEQKVGFLSDYKKEKLRDLNGRREDQGYVIRVSDTSVKSLRRIGRKSNKRATRTTFIENKSAEILKNAPELAILLDVCNKYHIVNIKSVELGVGEETVYDVTMPDTHSYLANGFISHNTSIVRGTKFVAKALPAPAILNKVFPEYDPHIWIGPSAAFHVDRMLEEIGQCDLKPAQVHIHPRAQIITEEHRRIENDIRSGPKTIASTMQGCAACMTDKIMRKPTVKLACDYPELEPYIAQNWNPYDRIAFLGETFLHEGSQGFSLDINWGSHYPQCTSRQTTAVQNLADMGLPAVLMGDVYGVLRPYPIRVGNVVEDGKQVGYSGDGYPDNKEITWADVKKESNYPEDFQLEEYTTVTKRLRRVFSFSKQQIREAVRVNGVTRFAFNFVNYIDFGCFESNGNDVNALPPRVKDFVQTLEQEYSVPVSLAGTGPTNDHVWDFTKE